MTIRSTVAQSRFYGLAALSIAGPISLASPPFSLTTHQANLGSHLPERISPQSGAALLPLLPMQRVAPETKSQGDGRTAQPQG